MRIAVVALLTATLALPLATSAFAGRIFGDIQLGGKSVAEGIKVKVTRPAAAGAAASLADSTTTDKFGSYKLAVKEEGKCVLSIVYEKTLLEIQVFSNKEATRYDLVVDKKDGKLILRRK